MKTVAVQDLDLASFQTFGSFSNLIDPKSFGFGKPPVEFYRDIIQQDLGGSATASYAICRVEARPLVITSAEFHNQTCEGILPLDNDVLIHVGPGTSPHGPVPVDDFQVYRVPKGTMVILRPGVWHHAPYTANGQPANVLIVLPERTYVNDCIAVRIEEERQLEITGV